MIDEDKKNLNEITNYEFAKTWIYIIIYLFM